MRGQLKHVSTNDDYDASDDSPRLAKSGPRRTEMVPIASLLPADSPRLGGEDEKHVVRLVEVEGGLPPILVHRGSMRVIDGVHRVAAAVRRGLVEIECEFFEGGVESAFVLAVEANVTHGLPLSLADRRAAAERIIGSHPEWSDRAVAASVGLAARTVCGIRGRASAGVEQLHSRVGRDGRVRPLSTAAGRRVASELMAARPGVSLREVAKVAGISPGTVRDVRERLRRGEDPVTPRRPTAVAPAPSKNGTEPATQGCVTILECLSKDPSLRLSESGRQLVRWLYLHAVDSDDCRKLVRAVPSHCAATVAKLARGCAEAWTEVSRNLDARGAG